MNTVIYYRKSLMEPGELEAASKYFKCVSLLTDIEEGDNVLYRYSLFPFPLDQEKEILNIGAKPIQSYSQHLYAADLQNWVADLKELTPLTWDNMANLPENGPFIVKGETNSRKSYWNTMMYAADKKEAIRINSELCKDSLIGDQKIYARQYIPLKRYLTGIGGVPISKEFRIFVAFGQVICGDYYWANYVDDLPEKPNVADIPNDFLQGAINRVKDHINFFAIDVAETENGDYVVIEVNDGCCSGLSCNDPEKLYSGLKRVLDERK